MTTDTVNDAHQSADRLREHIMHELLRLGTIKANVDNDRLTDAQFRQFIRNSVAG